MPNIKAHLGEHSEKGLNSRFTYVHTVAILSTVVPVSSDSAICLSLLYSFVNRKPAFKELATTINKSTINFYYKNYDKLYYSLSVTS